MSCRLTPATLVAVLAAAVLGAVVPGYAYGNTPLPPNTVTPAKCISGSGKIVESPVGYEGKPGYRCRGGCYNGNVIYAPPGTKLATSP